MTPASTQGVSGRDLAIAASLAAVSDAAAVAHAAQLQLEDLAEVLDGDREVSNRGLAGARYACTAARRSLRIALLALDGLDLHGGEPVSPHQDPRRRC